MMKCKFCKRDFEYKDSDIHVEPGLGRYVQCNICNSKNKL